MRNKGRNLFFTSLKAILIKEFQQVLRSPDVLMFLLVIPVFEMFLIGYALDINVRKIETVVYDSAYTQDSRNLIRQFSNTSDFLIVGSVTSDKELYEALTNGKAKVAIKIPYNYSRQLIDGNTANVQVLVDGSNAPITIQAINTSNTVTLQESINRLLNNDSRGRQLPVEMRTSVLFNPASRSANFFLPGLVSFESSLITIILASLSIVGEREKGNLEQLSMTPINYRGMIIGKMLPYGLFAVLQEIILLMEMRYGFNVPIEGNVLLLLLLSLPYIFICLSIGIIVSALTDNQIAAIQLGTLFRILPAIYLSGYIFPVEGMPPIFQKITKFIPEWHFMEISRGIILRGAAIEHLWWNALSLLLIAVVIFFIAVLCYRRKVI